jgi:hypothetical protein
MMKKMLFAMLLAAYATSANAATYMHYVATGQGPGTLLDQNSGISHKVNVNLVLDYIISLDLSFAHCTGDHVCSLFEGYTLDSGAGTQGFHLYFSPPSPPTPDKYEGGVAFGYVLLPGDKRLDFGGPLTSVTMSTFESDNPLLTTFTVTATPNVPEPASWALMSGGCALVGAGLRRSPKRTSYAVSCSA